MSQELVDSVNELTNETTKLLGMYTDSKVTIDEKVAKASSSAATATVKAAEAKESAAQSQDSYNKAYIEADRSKTEADRSQTAADRAELVTGMDTAQQLVDLAVTEGFVPVQAQIDAVQADTKLPIVHAPLDNKLSLHAGIGEPVFVKSANQSVEIPAQNITVGAETVTIPQQSIVIEGQEIEVPDIQQIKFSRASKAWLDGREYGVDEPRYTSDGKLLIERQSTNLHNNSAKPCTLNNGENQYFLDVETTDPFGNPMTLSRLHGEGRAGNGYYYVQDYPLLNFSVSVYFLLDIETIARLETVEGSFEFNKTTGEIVAASAFSNTSVHKAFGDWYQLSATVNLATSRSVIGVSCGYSEGTTLTYGIQIEDSNYPSSYIPTSGTAVTRAADIATINGQNVVSRWENDQQPLDTDTPRLLANGEHDMSADRLFKFVRSTSAWLNGVEYVAGEPRYKDGKLLIEGQATNFWGVNYVMLLGADYTSREKINVLGRYEITRVTMIGSGSTISAWGNIPGSKFLIFVYKKDAAISGFKDANLECGVNFKLDNNQLPVVDESVIGYTEYGEYVEVRLRNLKPTGKPVNFCIVIAESHEIATLTSAEYGIVSLSDTSTSFIPTTTTAVTRAADYAHVISKQAINTPTGLLPIGEHSVEPTAIRSFKRDTSAWLDGVEYPANTPRYLENGQLLIEGQNTNHFYRSESVGSGGESINCIDHIISIEGVPTPAVKMTPVADAYTFTRLHLPLGRGKIYDISCFVHTDTFQATPPVLFSGSYGGFHKPFVITEIVAGTLWKYEIKELELFGNSGFGWSPIHFATAVECHVTQMMFILSSEPTTSYIPTSGTAVTRAADDCFVDYQLPPNTYRDLKGFKA